MNTLFQAAKDYGVMAASCHHSLFVFLRKIIVLSLPFVQNKNDFPNVNSALDDPNGLLAFGHTLTTDLLVEAYYQGIFPWFNDDQPVLWWSPDPRAAFSPEYFKPSKSLQKSLKKQEFTVTLNQQFTNIINKCSETSHNRPDTWINSAMIDAYSNLYHQGIAHSIEVFQNEALVGGLYGVSMGKLFFGESMFHRATDASKIALWFLIEHCKTADFPLIDCQLPNAHLMSLGAKELPRNDFLRYLYDYRNESVPTDFWQPKVLYKP